MVSLYDIWRGDVIPASGLSISIGRNTYDGAAPAVPVNDLHLIELDLYATGTNTDPAIVTYNPGNARLELSTPVAVPGSTQAIVTAIIEHVYDNEATGTNAFSSATPVVFRAESTNTHSDVYSWAGNTDLTINLGGVYEMHWRVSAIDNGGAGSRVTTFSVWLEEDQGGGFTEVPGTRSFGVSPVDITSSVKEGTANGFTLINVAPGYIYRVVAEETSGNTCFQVEFGSSFLIKRMY